MPKTQIKQKPTKSKGAGKRIYVVLFLLLLVGLLSYGGWLLYKHQQKKPAENYASCAAAGNPIQQTDPPVCVSKDGKRFVGPSAKQDAAVTPAPAVKAKYLALKEWNLRVPLTSSLDDLTYSYVKNDSYESMFFTYKRLQDAGICKSDVGVAMSRSKTKNNPPYDIDNPAVFVQVGEYYYYLAFGGSYCYDTDNAGEVSLVKTIEPTGDLIKAVKSQLQNLQLAP